jgi:hypothetical protein
MTEASKPRGHQRAMQEKAVDELSKFVILFGYLWIVFELLSAHKNIVLAEFHLDYPEHAFAIINSLVFARVLLMRNFVWDIVLKLSQYLRAETKPRPRETNLWPIDSRIRSLGIKLSSPASGLSNPGGK